MKIKKGWILCIILIGSIISQAQAQYTTDSIGHKGFQKDKLFTGGNVGLSFGNITYFNLSPLIGYRFSNLFAAGLQINGQYESVRYKDFSNTVTRKERYGMVGLGVFGRVYPIPQIFLHVQPELNFIMGKVKDYTTDPPNEQKYHEQVPSFLVGGGYSQSIGGNSAFVIMILYDILQDDNSPYGNQPIFRVGVNLGL